MKSESLIAVLAANLLLVPGAASVPLPSPKPIENIYINQLPDFGVVPVVAGDYAIVPTLLSAGVDLNDDSELTGKPKRS